MSSVTCTDDLVEVVDGDNCIKAIITRSDIYLTDTDEVIERESSMMSNYQHCTNQLTVREDIFEGSRQLVADRR